MPNPPPLHKKENERKLEDSSVISAEESVSESDVSALTDNTESSDNNESKIKTDDKSSTSSESKQSSQDESSSQTSADESKSASSSASPKQESEVIIPFVPAESEQESKPTGSKPSQQSSMTEFEKKIAEISLEENETPIIPAI